jgi:ABC-type amino acid transport substrate-binding protein
MLRWLLVLFAFHGTTSLLLAQADGNGKANGPLRWGADAEGGAPFIFKDPANLQKNVGFEVDLAAALAKELGRPIEF